MTDRLTHEVLVSLLNYEPSSGVWTWRVNRKRSAMAGTVAGSADAYGYAVISIFHRKYKAHRLAVFFMTGAWPRGQVDHRNGQRSDNRWSNIRDASHAENQRNVGKRAGAAYTSRHKGVSFCQGKWQSRITANGESMFLGTFCHEQDAADAYKIAAQKLHGDFART